MNPTRATTPRTLTQTDILNIEQTWIESERTDMLARSGRIAQVLAALSGPTRIQIALILATSPGSPSQLATVTELSRSTISHHLNRLTNSGIVSSKLDEDSRGKVYRLTSTGHAIISAITENLPAATPAASPAAAHATRTTRRAG